MADAHATGKHVLQSRSSAAAPATAVRSQGSFKSLRTSDPEEAKLLSLKVAGELKKMFAALNKKARLSRS